MGSQLLNAHYDYYMGRRTIRHLPMATAPRCTLLTHTLL